MSDDELEVDEFEEDDHYEQLHALDMAIILDKLGADIEFDEDLIESRYDPSDDDSMVAFAEEALQVKMRDVPVVLDVFLHVVRRARKKKSIRLAILGPRSGGKTRLAATIEVTLWRWFGYDCQNVGGSLEQAQQCYEYVGEAARLSPDISDWMQHRTLKNTIGRDGSRIRISAASQTSVRGKHPRGSSGGGLLYLDEVAQMDDSIVDAAKYQLGAAEPSALIQTSTMGEEQTGRWWELLQNLPPSYKLASWDVFDIAKRCTYDCETTCPVKEHFSVDYERELAGGETELVHRAYCGGKAHDVDGWFPVDEIAEHFHDSPREVFEREMMGWASSKVGHVFDPVLIENLCPKGYWLSKDKNVDEHWSRFRKCDKKIGHDWGWAQMSCACHIIRVRDTLVVYAWEMWDHVQFRQIRKHLISRAYEDRTLEILPDSAEPSENDAMLQDSDARAMTLLDRDDAFDVMVSPVVFSKWKQYGYGEVRNRMEKGTILFPRHFGGRPVPGWEQAMQMLKAHRRASDGKPAKLDDHPSDALMCGVLGWSGRWAMAETKHRV